MRALDALTLTLGGALDNSGGMTGQDWLADIAGELVNGGVLQFATAQVTAGAIDNRGGELTAATALTLTSRGAFDNRGGTVSGGALKLTVSGALDNQAGGVVQSSTAARVQAAELFNNGGALGGGRLTLDIGGGLDNALGRIDARQLVAQAQSLNNRGGVIYGGESATLTVSREVDNRGGQFGGGTVTVSAGGLFDNTAGGSLLTEVGASIGAAQIANGGGYILGGAWIELSAAGDLDNAGGVIWSGGSLAASSAGGSLLNRAGYVLADGDLDLRVRWHIDNPNDSVIQAGGNAYLRAARIDNGSPADYRLTSIRDGAGYTDVYVTRVLAGAPAMISADGDLTIVAGADDDTANGVLFNESSMIGAGGNLNIAAARFDNHATAFQDYDYDETGGVSHIPKNVPYIVAYDPAFEDRWALFEYFAREIGGVTSWFDYDKTDNQRTWVNIPATVQAGGNITVSVGEFINTGYFHGRDLVIRAATITNGITDYFTQTPSGGAARPPVTIDVGGLSGGDWGVELDLSGWGVTLPKLNDALFKIDIDPDSKYLVAVNIPGLGAGPTSADAEALPWSVGAVSNSPYSAVLASQLGWEDAQWSAVGGIVSGPYGVTTDYLVAGLGLSLADWQEAKWFADPVYEERLLQTLAMYELGTRFFDNEWTTAREQRQGLYDNALEFARANPSVELGQALTPELVAQLSNPIVWYVEQELAGQKIMVPTVYLPDGWSAEQGALIGGQIKAESALLVADGLLHNTGFINVKEDLTVSAGEFLNEQRIAQAQQDVKIEGLFGSKRKTIYYDALQAGGDITAGNIVIVSEGDFTNLGGRIASVGDLTVVAGGEIVNQAQRWEFVVDWNQGVLGSLFGAKSYDIGVGFEAGELLSGGNLYLQADQSIQNIGSTIAALGDVTLVADELIKQDLQYASYTSYQGVKFSGFGFSFEDKKEIVTQRAETTSLTGDVTFISRGDIENRGSGITAGRDLWLQAADNVRLDALTVEVKESSWDFGFTGNGFSYNQSDWNRTKTEQSKLVSGGNTTLVAGNDVTGQAVQMYVGNDLTVAAGRDIAFEQETVNHYYNSSGWEIGVSAMGAELLARAVVQGGDIFQALIDSVPGGSQIQDLANAKSGWDIADSTTQLGMTGWNALNAFGNASNPYTEGTALDGVAAVYGVDTGANGGGFNMQITVNLSNYEVRDKWTESFGTDLNVGGNVQMQAGNDLQLKGGTQVNAEGDITLVAGHDLLIEAAKDTRSHDSRTTGGKFG
ncbi:MAG: hemagglutinin repeat-containing protein, partial [Verrucomicrobiales bacterium]|nr:hemagglutinin repeat-containing protein [Verrucomicrobiales bacterium]